MGFAFRLTGTFLILGVAIVDSLGLQRQQIDEPSVVKGDFFGDLSYKSGLIRCAIVNLGS